MDLKQKRAKELERTIGPVFIAIYRIYIHFHLRLQIFLSVSVFRLKPEADVAYTST